MSDQSNFNHTTEQELLPARVLIEQPLTAEEQAFADSAARRLLRAAARGEGVQPVLDEAHDILGLPIDAADTLFNPIGDSGMVDDGQREACKRNDRGNPASRRSWMRTVKGSKAPVVDETGGIRYRAMCFDAIMNGRELAKLTFFETRPFRVTDREVMRSLAEAVACVLSLSAPASPKMPNQLLCDLLQTLIDGRMDLEELKNMEQVLELPHEAERRILALGGGEGYTIDFPAIRMHCFQQFGMTTTLYRGMVFCMIEGTDAPTAEQLAPFLREYVLQGGVSRPFRLLSEVRDYAKQAAFALQCAKEDDAFVTEYGDCLLRDVAARCGEARAPRTFCRPEILTLFEYDQRYGTEYTRTLQCYCENMCSMADTARASFLHYNTIKYRMRMIREISGVSQITARDLFEFLLTFELLGLPANKPFLHEEEGGGAVSR